MRYLIFLWLPAILTAQPYSLRLGSSQVASTPQSPAFTLGNYRIEVGITKRSGVFDASDAGRQLFYDGGGAGVWRCQTDAGGAGVLLWCRDTHNTSQIAAVDITGMSDVRFRFQRSVNGLIGNSTWSVGLWDGQGNLITETTICPGSNSACTGETAYNWSAPIAVGNTNTAFDLRFIRWSSTLLPLGSKPPVEVPQQASNYVEYDFENSLNDSSGNGLNLTLSSGSPSYVASPTYAPVAGFGGLQPGIAANQNLTLHGDTYSFSSTNLDGNPSTYTWSLVSRQYAAMDGTLSAPASAVTGITLNDVLGTYTVQLQVTDRSGSASVISKIGAVPENADHTLKYYPNPATGVDSADVQFQTGKLVRYGTSAYAPLEGIMRSYADTLDFHLPTAGVSAYSGTGHLTSPGGVYHFVCDTPGTCHFASKWQIYYRSTGGLVSIVVRSNVATATIAAPHGFIVGRRLTVAGSATSALNGQYVVASIPASTTLTFTTSGVPDGTYTDSALSLIGGIPDPAGSGTRFANYFCNGSCPSYSSLPADNNLVSIAVSGTTATATTSVAHGLEVGQIVSVGNTNIAGLDSPYWIVSAVPGTTTFQFSVVPVRGGVTETPMVKPGTYAIAQSYVTVEESDFIWMWWNAPGDGNGRTTQAVATVVSDDDITINAGNIGNPRLTDASTGHQFSRPSRLELGFWTGSNTSWTYYEAPLALAREFLTTGIDTYLTKFRNATDVHWDIAQDHGYAFYAYGEPRVFALRSVIVRALDAYPQWWDGIAYHLHYNNANGCETQTSALAQGYGFSELRDASYNLSYTAAIARSAQNSSGNADTATRASYCTFTKQCVNNIFAAAQMANGAWRMDPSSGNRDYPFVGPGVYPWMMGLATNALSSTHSMLTDGVSCSNLTDRATVATTALSTLKKAVDFEIAQAFDSNLGSFYAVDFTFAPDGGSSPQLPGTIAVTNGSTGVFGSATSLSQSFLPDGTTMMFVNDGHVATGSGAVASVISDTSLTFTSPWSSATQSPAVGYSKTSSCATVAGRGKLTFHQNNATVTGDGSLDLRTIFLPDRTTYVQPYGLTDRRMFRIVGVAANSLTMETAWQYADYVSSAWKKVSGGCTDVCGPHSTAASCTGFANGGGLQYGAGFVGDIGNNTEQLAGIGYYYAASGDTSYKAQLGDLLNATFPAGIQPYLPLLAKIYGQIAGAGGNPNALAYILGPPGACAGLSFSPASHNSPAGGDSGSILVTVPDQTCSWTATASAPWLSVTSGAAGVGNGTIGYRVAANIGAGRAGSISSNHGTPPFAVNQDSGCTFGIAPGSGSVGAAGGVLPVAITASDASCPWTTSSSDSWLTLSKASGSGSDSVNIVVAANQGGWRASAVTIADYTVSITEAGAVSLSSGTSITGAVSISGRNLQIQ